MSNTTPMVPKNFGPPPKGIEEEPDDVLRDRPSFAVVIQPNKGQWGIRYQQNDWLYQDAEGNPIPNFEVVIVKSRENTSNKYYEKWEANSKRPPQCFASDGITPDERVPLETKQHPTCAGCPQKVPGSAFTASGKPTTKCRNERKVAMIPLMHFSDRKFEEYGGPALYTITPASLKAYTSYLDRIKAMGQKAFSVVTRMRFDPDPAIKHQKIIFTPYRALSDEEFELARELRHDPRTARVLEEEPEIPIAPPDEYDEETGEITPAPKPTPPAPKPAANPAPASAAQKAPAPPPPRGVTLPPGPPAPKPGGFAATSVNAAMAKPAQRPTSVRTVEPPPVEEEQEEESYEDEMIDDGLNEELDDDLKRLLSSD